MSDTRNQFSGDEPSLSKPQPRTDDVRLGGDSALMHVIDSLNHSDPTIRKRAAFMLAERGDSHAYDALMRLYEKGERSLRVSSLRALGKLGDVRAFDLLIALLDDEHQPRQIRIAAADALGDLGDVRAVEPILRLLELRYQSSRQHPKTLSQALLHALIKLRDSRANDFLLHLFVDYEPWMIVEGTIFLPLVDYVRETLGDQLVPYLVNAASENGKAVHILTSLGERSAASGLVALLPEALEQGGYGGMTLARAIAELGGPAEVDPLLTLLDGMDTSIYSSVGTEIVATLGKLGDARAVEPLIALLESKWAIAAAYALGDLGDARAVEPLIRFLNDDQEFLRHAVHEALVSIGTPEALAALRDAGQTNE